MKLKRLVTSLSANFETFIARVENHEAVAEAAIADVQKAAARIRSEKIKVDRRIDRLTEEKNRQEAEIARWKARARACLAADENKAMACLRQAAIIKKQGAQTGRQRDDMQSLSHSLAGNLREVENRLDDLNRKRAMLASRETRASVCGEAARHLEMPDVDAVFDRWERRVLESEYRDGGGFFADHPPSGDPELAKSFEAEEEEAELRASLEALKAEMRPENDPANP